MKMEEFVTRLLEVQAVLSDHEHALQHQAEELLNRTTKYDLMLCEQRIDDCALRDKVEADVKELKNLTRWQSSKLEKLGAHQGFAEGRPARSDKEHTDAEATSGRRSSTGRVGLPAQDGGLRTELLGDLREQLERVAQGVLGLSHLALRGTQQQAKSREERQLREAELIHHLSCIVDWIVNKAAPADWDKARFVSLVTATSIPGDVDRRRSTLSALSRSAGPSQSTAAPSPSTMTLSMSKERRLDSSASREADLDGLGSPEDEEDDNTDDEDNTDEEEREEKEPKQDNHRYSERAMTPVRPPSRMPNPLRSPRVASKRGSAVAGMPVARKQPISMGGGFKGRLVKTRVVPVQDTAESPSSARRTSTSPAEVLPRLFEMLDEERGSKAY